MGKILLVDDEAVSIDVGGQMLTRLGYAVLTADSGAAAVSRYRENAGEIQLVILDMIMPDQSGDETFDRLKEIHPEIKVLLSSGYSINGQATEMIARGCNGFIQKPFTLESLSDKVKEVLLKGK